MMSRVAVIVGDLQIGITRQFPFVRELVPRAAAMAAAARARNDLVVFVRTQFRSSGADVTARNAAVRALFDSGDAYHDTSPTAELDPGLAMASGDVVVTKSRTSAFAGTDLDSVLRANDIDTVVVAGVATSAMVAATVYSAADRDYLVRVAGDVCADPDPSVHDAFMNKIFPGRGIAVVTSTELDAFDAPGRPATST